MIGIRKIVAVVVWAGVAFCWQPLRGQAPGVGTQIGHRQEQKADPNAGHAEADQRGTPSSPFIVETYPRPDNPEEAAEHKAENDTKEGRDRRTFNLAVFNAIVAGLLVVVGWCGIRAAIRTLKAMEDQGEQMRRQVALMEAPFTQWIEVKNWFCKATEGDKSVSQIMVSFEIANPTNYPLVIQSGNVNFTLGSVTTKLFTGDGLLLPPNRPPCMKQVELKLTEEDSRQFLQGGLVISVQGSLDFVDLLRRQQPHPVQGRLWCKVDGAGFDSDTIWTVRAADSNKGEEKAG